MSTAFDCPRCGTLLSMSERAGIEIDYCPKCRGVWLDRGELDKIIERSVQQPPEQRVDQPPADPRIYAKHGHEEAYGNQGHRRKSWLHDIFD